MKDKTNRDIKWSFMITIIKLLKPEDLSFDYPAGAVYNQSKFVGLCEWARNG